MARPRTPTNLLKLRGAFRKNPQRARQDPEPAGEFGDPPEHLSAEEVACWRELEGIAPVGVLTAGDRWIVEMASRLMAEYRALGRDFPTARLQRLHSVCAALGMSPADRSKVAIPSSGKPAEDDPWDL